MSGDSVDTTQSPAETPLPYRYWFWSFVAGFCLLMLGAMVSIRSGIAGQRLGYIAFFIAYMSLACTFCPLPTLPVLLKVAAEFEPVFVALLGALGTCVANMNDYYLLSFFLGFPKVEKVRRTRAYKLLLRGFDKAPFLILSVATFLPISVDVIRLLAISRRYSRRKFVAATFVGRFPRYLIIAFIGHELKLSWGWIIAVFVVVSVWGISQFIYNRVRTK